MNESEIRPDRSDLPVFYGLPLLDEDGEMRTIPKREIRQLRRPVRGAFTGGFSAGYFNSVSSEAGFEPQTFISSRTQRASQKSIRKPEDFMDPEDFTIHGIAPKLIRTRNDFKVTIDGVNQLKASKKALRLLECLGWKPGQGVGPRVALSTRQNFYPEEFKNITLAPSDSQSIEIIGKTNNTGIGYIGLCMPHAPLPKSLTVKSFLPKGHAFGVGVLNDSDDEQDMMAYAEECMDDYDFELGSKPIEASKTSMSSELSDFEYVSCLQSVQFDIPKDCVIGCPVPKPKPRSAEIQTIKKLSIQQRAVKFGFKTEWENKLAADLGNRFRSKNSKEDEPIEKDESMEAAHLGLSGKLTRTETVWIPDQLVFKMFNLAIPKHLEQNKRNVESTTVSVFDVLDIPTPDLTMNAISKSLGIAVPVNDEAALILAQLDQWRKEVDDEESQEDRRPPIDLFKAIFSEQNEASDDDSDEYYGPKLPPNFLENQSDQSEINKTCWKQPKLDSHCFVERDTNVAKYDARQEDKWEWANRGLGERKRTAQ